MTAISVEQVATECWCGISYMIPKNLERQAHESADDPAKRTMSVYCPLGHAWVYNPSSEVKRLRDELTRKTAQLDRANARAASAEAQALRVERKLRRVKKGTCPECQRHFVNVERHMKTKHSKGGV